MTKKNLLMLMICQQISFSNFSLSSFFRSFLFLLLYLGYDFIAFLTAGYGISLGGHLLFPLFGRCHFDGNWNWSHLP